VGRPTKHDAGTRTALLDAAESLLARGGPDAVSVRAVADAIDASTRAVYAVFGSKDALLAGLAARGFQYLADLVDAAETTDDPVADLVGIGVGGFRKFAVGRPHLFRITFDGRNAELIRRPEVTPQLQRALAGLMARVERARASRGAVTTPSLELAYMFHATCHGLAANELSRSVPPVGVGMWPMTSEWDMAGLWAATLDALVRGLLDRG